MHPETPLPVPSEHDARADALAALLSRVGRGDRAAFEQLYRGTSAVLLGVCMRVLGDRAEAEDVLQEVYVSVWGKAAQFDGARARAMTWLATIARNRSIDRRRALPSTASRAPIEWAEDIPDPDPSPALRAEAATQRLRLDECLGGLEPRRRGLIRVAFFEGATYEELAQRSGTPLGSVKSWIRRGLLQLRTCLER